MSPNSGGGARFNVNIVSNTYENGQGIITFDGDLVWIGQSAFYSTNLTTVILSNSLKTLNTPCFLECMDLQSVTLPMGIDTIGQGAFATCSSLTPISILRNAAIDSINTIKQSITNPHILVMADNTIAAITNAESENEINSLV